MSLIAKKDSILYSRDDVILDPRCMRMLGELGHFVIQCDMKDERPYILRYMFGDMVEILKFIQPESFHNQLIHIRLDYVERCFHVKYIDRVLISTVDTTTMRLSTSLDNNSLLLHFDTISGMLGVCPAGAEFLVDPAAVTEHVIHMAPIPVRIVCAAEHHFSVNGKDPVTIIGVRHNDTFTRRTRGTLSEVTARRDAVIEGFVDQRGTFYNRLQAWHIAELNKQILRRTGGDGATAFGLFSENLY